MRRTSSLVSQDQDCAFVNRKQSLVAPEFQMSMLRVSLEEKDTFSAPLNGQEVQPKLSELVESDRLGSKHIDREAIKIIQIF